MPKINVLPKNIAELIAAGEVVERPASVIKELVENSIDAKADNITVEISGGGISYIRITDNGIGFEHEDVPTAFLRHATSKISTGDDLYNIATLGFRGEALAAISSVAKIELFTKTRDSEFGTHYMSGEETVYEEAGCPDGTTLIVRDIFYNTPARMKFLKKDVSEGNAVASVLERIALSHPEISFKFIRDGKQIFATSGDGKIESVVYSVLGRELSSTLISVSGETDRIVVSGLTCKPIYCKSTRNYQYTFLNGRLVRSGTVIAAAEQAYKNSAMVGKFPAFVLYLTVPFDTVDVNVHPAKTEVRFSDERRIFDAVYAAIKTAIAEKDTRPEVKLNSKPFNPFERMKTEEYRQQEIKETIAEKIYNNPSLHNNKHDIVMRQESKPLFMNNYSVVGAGGEKVMPKTVAAEETKPIIEKQEQEVNITTETIEKKPEIRVIGEAFSTYIIVQMEESVYMIDKHAAHERILYNSLKEKETLAVQELLTPVTVTLSYDEYTAIINGSEKLEELGFEIDDFGNSSVRVLALPVVLTEEDIPSLVSELAESLKNNQSASLEKIDNLYHTVACRAAIKAGNKITPTEMKVLAEKVLYSKEIMYCPHGRPVAFEIKKRELEKQFGRIQ